ncbi:MAG: hypothetical protein GY859_39930 [Desulfobacterales bacterium]|nr:hypothetical protein [Desulfobacterales bacterium]
MEQGNKLTAIVCVVFVGIILQVVLACIPDKDSPTRTAREFTKAYYMLDPEMSDWLCKELAENEEGDPVDAHIYKMSQEALKEGYKPSFKRKVLYHFEIEELSRDESSVKMIITATAKRCINPAYALVAKFFFLGNTYSVKETLELIKEDGKWKVCGAPFGLSV